MEKNGLQNIVLTGVTSFLGRNLIKDLMQFYHVRCLIRQNSKYDDELDIDYYKIDFTNPTFDKTLFENVYGVVHVLSLKSSSHPDILNINVNFTRKLVDTALANKVKKFIYISSETVQLPARDLYTISKKLAEEEVMRYKNYLILRPTVVYGKHDKDNIGFLIEIVKHSPIIPIIGTGKQLIQPVYVKDVSKCIISGLLNDIRGTYVIAGHNPLQYKEIVDVISEALEKKRVKLFIPFSVSYILAKFFEIFGLSFIQKSQIDNLKIDRKHSIENTEKIFGTTFSDPKEQIYKLVKEIDE